MVSQEKRTDLSNMYTLLKPIPDGLKNLIQTFLDHVKNEGIETISTLKGENVCIALSIANKFPVQFTIFPFPGTHSICGKYATSPPQIRTINCSHI